MSNSLVSSQTAELEKLSVTSCATILTIKQERV